MLRVVSARALALLALATALAACSGSSPTAPGAARVQRASAPASLDIVTDTTCRSGYPVSNGRC